MLYCGIDEAGYGPLIGPLCVAATVFEVERADEGRAPDLWNLLRSAVTDTPADRSRIAIADSKRLKGQKDGKAHPLRHLERGVLAALGHAPATDADLHAALGVDPDGFGAPWYAAALPLPLANERDSVAVAANRFHVAARDAGVRVRSIACSALDGREFNRLVGRSQKSDVNFLLAMRHVDRIWREHGAAHPRVVVDRHGGRTHYRDELMTSFPDARLAIVAETEAVSRYRLERDGHELTLSFEVESESRHLPSALASMTAKLVRELFMERLNRFFRGHLPELKPTAGYVEDGRRYLGQIRPVLSALGVSDDAIVRQR